ncbi:MULTISPECIES: hypothetical protein [Burkholderiaceae]|uniref:hypothetical protein n=1 Tax=Burkholderiaceae TaxID=119060 RepID=UPI00141EE16C|nr:MULTISPECIES: hypothetical protein [Burkholderiaceae]NIF54760.1 hypothetical protein [Burkholderia sp. Ax-1724]NIF79192.1 hypothetical protein [Paraburkholderia sp. Cy-641]
MRGGYFFLRPLLCGLLFFQPMTLLECLARVMDWEPLYRLWELIVMICKFLWDLLRLLSGGG